tara:strand:- start:697 stop:891 length:195 start_codon:yes stop_codon:yes gene_type:complete
MIPRNPAQIKRLCRFTSIVKIPPGRARTWAPGMDMAGQTLLLLIQSAFIAGRPDPQQIFRAKIP